MSLIKTVLKSKSLNPLLRSIASAWLDLDKKISQSVIERIRYAGTADLQVDDVKFKMTANCDDGIVDALYFRKEDYAEITEIRLFKNFSARSKVILDIGANTGLYSIVSQKNNPKAQVYSFEPYIINARRLKENLAANNLNNVNVVEKAVGNSTLELEFTIPENDQICDVLSADTQHTNKFYREWINYKNVKVEQTTIDTFCSEANLKALDLIKIDVENYETAVLEGASESLQKFDPVIFIEIFVNPEKTRFYEEFLKPKGYYCYSILKEGIMQTKTLIENPDCRNFILSKAKSKSEYLSYSNMENVIEQLQLAKVVQPL